jgi:hypothetical protein
VLMRIRYIAKVIEYFPSIRESAPEATPGKQCEHVSPMW